MRACYTYKAKDKVRPHEDTHNVIVQIVGEFKKRNKLAMISDTYCYAI